MVYRKYSITCCLQSGENALVLQQTITLVERAISLAPLNSQYIIEVHHMSPMQCTTCTRIVLTIVGVSTNAKWSTEGITEDLP